MKAKTFNEKIVECTCIFCGAPKLNDSDKCNYCGSHYIPSDEFIQIYAKKPEAIRITPTKVDYSGYGQLGLVFEKPKEIKFIIDWFNVLFNHEWHKNHSKKLLVEYKDQKIILINAFPTMIASSAYDADSKKSKYPKKLDCTIIFDYFYFLEK